MNKLKKYIVLLTAVCSLLSLAACGVDSPETIDSKYSVETVNITKINELSGVDFYVPDIYLNEGKLISSSSQYELSGKDFYVNVISNDTNLLGNDLSDLSDKVSQIFDKKIIVNKILNEDKWECLVEYNDASLNGYIRKYEGYIVLAIGTNDDTSLTIVDSLKKGKTYKKNSESIETVKLNSSDLSATVNGVGIGEAISIDDIQSDFDALAKNHEQMKAELSNINGNTIQEINKNVIMQFNAISAEGSEAQQAYLNSVYAYNDAINDYNIAISNGIDLMSTKKDIEAAMNIDLSPDWEKLVIENENTESSIRSIIIEYSNEKDKITSIIINKADEIEAGDNSIKDKINEKTADSESSSLDNNELTIEQFSGEYNTEMLFRDNNSTYLKLTRTR